MKRTRSMPTIKQVKEAVEIIKSFIEAIEKLKPSDLEEAIIQLSQIGESWGEDEEWTYDTEKNYPKEFEILNQVCDTLYELKGNDNE